MKADLTASQLYWNPQTLGKFFFREQSYKTFEELLKSVADVELVFDLIDEHFDDLDEFEELCYNESVEDIKEILGY